MQYLQQIIIILFAAADIHTQAPIYTQTDLHIVCKLKILHDVTNTSTPFGPTHHFFSHRDLQINSPIPSPLDSAAVQLT